MEPILVVAPNAGALETLRRPLKDGRTLLLSTTSADSALVLARKHTPKVAVVDLTSESHANLALADTLTRDTSLPFIAVLLIGTVPASERLAYEGMLRQPGVVVISRRLSNWPARCET
jgi:CheY-like chemotaxis protein